MFFCLDLKDCTDRLRLAFILCNIPIFLVGLSLIGIGIWQVVLDSNIEEVVPEVNGRIIAGLFIASGGGIAIISIFGVLGASFKSRLMLSTYAVVLFLAILSEIAVVGYSFWEAGDLEEEQIVNNLIRALLLYYPEGDIAYDEDNNDVVDFIQESLECCGVNSIDDWETYSPYHEQRMRLPASCCGREEPDACPNDEAFTDACGEPFYDFVVENLQNMAIIAIAFAAFEVLVLVKACVLLIVVARSFC